MSEQCRKTGLRRRRLKITSKLIRGSSSAAQTSLALAMRVISS